MTRRYFNVEDAQALLPRLSEMLEALRRLRDQTVLQKTRLDQLWTRLDAGEPVLTSLGEQQREMDRLTAGLVAAAKDVEATGCLLRDVDLGLVDFPFRTSRGATVFLCWRRGESGIAFWHGVEEGYAGRKPLSQLLDQV
jgi:hypothetical protein